MSRANPPLPMRARRRDAGHGSPETVAVLPRGDADGDPARGDAAGPLALLDRPAGLEGRPRRHPEDALGERRPLRKVKWPPGPARRLSLSRRTARGGPHAQEL